MRLRTVLLALAAAFGIGAVAAPATAGILDDLLSGPGGVLGQTLTAVDERTCPTVGDVPGIGPTVCSLSVAGFQYRTTFLRPDGTELVRTVNATAAVPALLRVDGDLTPDLTATLLPKSTSRFELTVLRNLTAPAYLPYKVEIIVPDPTGKLPRQKIFLGYDATSTGKSPNTWKGEVRILESTPTRTALGFQVTRSDNPAISRIATIGGLFNGDPGNRIDPISAVLDQQPMPKTFGARLVLAEDENHQDDMTIGVGASSPITLTGDVLIAQGAERRVLRAQAVGLPGELTVDLDAIADGQQKVTYVASDRVPSLSLDSDLQVSGASRERLKLDLADVPTGIVFNQTSKQAGNVTTTGGSVGSALVQVSTRGYQVPLLPKVGAFAQYETPASFATPNAPSMLAVRVEKLLAASYDVGADTSVDLQTTPVPIPVLRQNLKIRAIEKNRTVEATVVNLPEHVTFSATEDGRFSYNGYLATVPEVTATIRALNGTTLSENQRYTHLDARVLALPPAIDIDVAPDNNRVTADAQGGTVGLLEADAYTPGAACLADIATTVSGAVIVDTPAEACAAGRFAGLQSADVSMDPIVMDIRSGLPQRFVVRGTFNEADDAIAQDGVLLGNIENIPTEFSLVQTGPSPQSPFLDTMKYTIDANDQVGLIQLNGTHLPEPFPGEVLGLTVQGLAEGVVLELPLEGADPRVSALAVQDPADPGDEFVDLVEGEVRSGSGVSCLLSLGGESGVALVDTPSQQCAGGRFKGLEKLDLTVKPLSIDAQAALSQKFLVRARFDDPTDNVTGLGVLDADVDLLPRQVSIVESAGGPGSVAEDPDATTMKFAVNTQPAIGSLTLNGTNLPASFPARYLKLGLTDLPTSLDLQLPNEGEVKKITASTGGQGVGEVVFGLSDVPTFPEAADGTDTLKIIPSGVMVRIHDLESAAVVAPAGVGDNFAGTLAARVAHSEPAKPLAVSVDKDGTLFTLDLPEVPQVLDFEKRGSASASLANHHPDVIRLRNSGPIPTLKFTVDKGTPLLVEAEVQNIPAALDLCLWSGIGSFHSAVDSVNPGWCYTPAKAHFDDGGDPFTVFDAFQASINNPFGGLSTPITLKKLHIRSEPVGGTSTSDTLVTDAEVGEATIAFGTGRILPVSGQVEEQKALYGGDVFDGDADENEGLHLFLNTDTHGLKGKIVAEATDPASEDSYSFTDFHTYIPLHGENAVRVLDNNGPVPNEEFSRGILSGCSLAGPLFGLTVDLWDTFDFTPPNALIAFILGCVPVPAP